MIWDFGPRTMKPYDFDILNAKDFASVRWLGSAVSPARLDFTPSAAEDSQCNCGYVGSTNETQCDENTKT